MKVFVALSVLCVAIATAQAEYNQYCYQSVAKACVSTSKSEGKIDCSARYGGIDGVLSDLQKYVNTHITRSYEFLLMSTHYANYEKNRAGFEKLLRGYSDEKWNNAIELIKYISKRGGRMDFNKVKLFNKTEDYNVVYEMNEIETLAMALDIEKDMAHDANKIHSEASHKNNDHYDPEVLQYIEEEFAERQAESIRTLAGHTTDLKKLLSGPDSSLALYLFDEMLQK
ncbi:PREDICTED: ferritin light chain, oocyte isoform [Nicrophorus vespilloides]|uniref:Ferritin n=1 Tax=Nicrophorus vespilloides TaxID=110193 RepID=A0ABM1M6X9_NICVS|nr:PREDICTED: ferritin light chain, oocyte isoform [Nicrophorus vespilloides]